jgi:hypothetical protein
MDPVRISFMYDQSSDRFSSGSISGIDNNHVESAPILSTRELDSNSMDLLHGTVSMAYDVPKQCVAQRLNQSLACALSSNPIVNYQSSRLMIKSDRYSPFNFMHGIGESRMNSCASPDELDDESFFTDLLPEKISSSAQSYSTMTQCSMAIQNHQLDLSSPIQQLLQTSSIEPVSDMLNQVLPVHSPIVHDDQLESGDCSLSHATSFALTNHDSIISTSADINASPILAATSITSHDRHMAPVVTRAETCRSAMSNTNPVTSSTCLLINSIENETNTHADLLFDTIVDDIHDSSKLRQLEFSLGHGLHWQ